MTTTGEWGYPIEQRIEVVEDYVLPEATGGQGGYMGAWEEPDPIELQGIDCVAHCNGATDGPSTGTGGAASTGGPSADVDDEKSDSGSDKGCTVASGSAGRWSAAPWLLLGALLLRRRRRSSTRI
jgi:MYXO-CTERM domain-containing protein